MTAKPDNAPLPPPRLYKGAVASVEEIAADTRIFRIDTGGPLPHRAGQYALLHAEGFEPREFSIASVPDAPNLEFHIKTTGRGISQHIFDTWKEGTDVALEAPYGDHFWRPAARPLLALAGGVGIAPIKAIIEAHLAHDDAGPAHLYWGVRDETHLYLDAFFNSLRKGHHDFHYVPLLGQGTAGPGHREGFIGPAVEQDFPTLAGFSIYIAGPRAMIEATLPVLTQKHADPDWLFSDAFGP